MATGSDLALRSLKAAIRDADSELRYFDEDAEGYRLMRQDERAADLNEEIAFAARAYVRSLGRS